MTSDLVETARAKINLTLRVLGRRPDGYHELESLVVFADTADFITLSPHRPAGVTNSGPFADEIVGDNLAAKAIAAALEADPHLSVGHVHLEKHLPIASGIGGGSADAAAVLRALQRLNGARASTVDWNRIAAGLGADVTACLASRPLVMRGTGERVSLLEGPWAPLPAVLVTPRLKVPPGKTRAVYDRLAAGPPHQRPAAAVSRPDFAAVSRTVLLGSLQAIGNDLEPPAIAVMPGIADVLACLRSQPLVDLARLSGSGPTCFALCACDETAAAVAADMERRQPGWWVRATRLG